MFFFTAMTLCSSFHRIFSVGLLAAHSLPVCFLALALALAACGLWLATQVTRNFAMTGEGGLAAWPWWMDGKTRSFFVHGNTQWPNGIQAYSRDQLAAAMANKPWVL